MDVGPSEARAAFSVAQFGEGPPRVAGQRWERELAEVQRRDIGAVSDRCDDNKDSREGSALGINAFEVGGRPRGASIVDESMSSSLPEESSWHEGGASGVEVPVGRPLSVVWRRPRRCIHKRPVRGDF